MASRKTPPRVPAHTNAIGNHKMSKTASEHYVLNVRTGSVTQLSKTISNYDRSYKSTIVDGGRVGEFRTATNYCRMVMRSIGYPANWEAKYGGVPTYAYTCSDSLVYFGFNAVTCPAADFTRGTVVADANLQQAARISCRNKMTGASMNAAASLAELKQAVNGTVERIWSIVEALIKLKRRDYVGAYRALTGKSPLKATKAVRRLKERLGASRHDPAAWWLEWLYHWRPILSDIWSLTEIIKDGLRKPDLLFSETSTKSKSHDPRLLFTTPKTDAIIGSTGKVTESVRCTMWGKIHWTMAASLRAWGFNNPQLVLWELVPFSFVVDWLLPIGQWLESINALAGVSFVDCHEVHRLEGWAHAAYRNPGAGTNQTGNVPVVHIRILAMQRYRFASFPQGAPYIRDPFNLRNLGAAMALLASIRL